MENKSIKGKPGSIFKIPVDKEGNFYTYGQILKNGYLIIFDCKISKSKEAGLESILGSPVIFSAVPFTYVKSQYINKGLWPVIYHTKIREETESKVRPTFWQDNDNKHNCVLVYYDGTERKAAPTECIGLEMMMVWQSHTIEERLQKFYAGEPYEMHEMYQLKL